MAANSSFPNEEKELLEHKSFISIAEQPKSNTTNKVNNANLMSHTQTMMHTTRKTEEKQTDSQPTEQKYQIQDANMNKNIPRKPKTFQSMMNYYQQ